MITPLPDAASAEAMLGPEHPLASALARVHATIRQIGAVVAAAGVGLLADAGGRSWGTALAIAAGIVALALGGRLLVVLDGVRERAYDLIIAGQEELPVAIVQRQRRRLLRRDKRELLAGCTTISPAARRARAPGGRSARGGAGLDSLGEDLHAVADHLRGGDIDARAVALAERLVDDGGSPLYGSDLCELRCALRRVVW